VLFKTRFHHGILRGRITLTFRAWSRPQAKAGSRQRFGTYDGNRAASGFLEIKAVDLVAVSTITSAQARSAGFESRDALLVELARPAARPLTPKTQVYRIEFRYRRQADERAVLASNVRISPDEAAALVARLERMDAASKGGAWTRRALAVIAANPGVAASKLAPRLSRETQAFKVDVRKLKALGLTTSLEVGYKLSPRGRAFMRRWGT